MQAQGRRQWLAALVVGAGLMGGVTAAWGADHWPARAYVIRVDGLACPYCGYGIEKQFARQPGVTGTDIEVDAGVVIVTIAPGTRFPDRELERLVHDAGFELGGIVQRPAPE